MTYTVGSTVKTVYGEKVVIKANAKSILVSDDNGGTIKINKRQLEIMN